MTDKTVTMSRELAERLFARLESIYRREDVEELRALLAAPVVERQPVADSIAQMVTEWVETGIKLGTDWRNGLSGIIEKRLARFPASPPAPVADENAWRLDPSKRCPNCVGHGTYLDGAACGTCAGTGRPPAPVAVVLPDLSVIREYHLDATIRLDRYAADADMRKSDSEHYRKRAAFHRDQVATIDKLKELNQ